MQLSRTTPEFMLQAQQVRQLHNLQFHQNEFRKPGCGGFFPANIANSIHLQEQSQVVGGGPISAVLS